MPRDLLATPRDLLATEKQPRDLLAGMERSDELWALPPKEPEPEEGYAPTAQDIDLLQQGKLPKGFQEIGYTEVDIPEIKKQITYSIEPPKRAVEAKQYELFTDRTMKAVYGEDELEEIKTGQRRLNKFMRVAWRLPTYALAGPAAALTFEGLDQARNIFHSKVKGEKYDPTDRRMLSELIPETVPPAVRIGASLVEYGAEIVLVSKFMNMATEGTLRGALKDFGGKLKKAGYNVEAAGIANIPEEAIKRAARGTRLEKMIGIWRKAKKFKAKAAVKRRVDAPPGPVAPPSKVVTAPIPPLKPPITPTIPAKVPPLKPEVAKAPIVEAPVADKGASIEAEERTFQHFKQNLGKDADFEIKFLEKQVEIGTPKDEIINGLVKRKLDAGEYVPDTVSLEWLGRRIDEKETDFNKFQPAKPPQAGEVPIVGELSLDKVIAKTGEKTKWWKHFNQTDIKSKLKTEGQDREKSIPITRKEAEIFMDNPIVITTRISGATAQPVFRIEQRDAETTGDEGWYILEGKINFGGRGKPITFEEQVPIRKLYEKIVKENRETQIGEKVPTEAISPAGREIEAPVKRIIKPKVKEIPTLDEYIESHRKGSEVVYRKALTAEYEKKYGKVKEVPAPKGKVTILPRKEQLLKQVDEAIKKARPKADISTEDAREGPKVTFQLDGGAEIINTKEALTEFRKQIAKTAPSMPSRAEVPKLPSFTSRAARAEVISEGIKTPKGYFTDGRLIIKGEDLPKAKKISDRPEIPKKELEDLLQEKTEPATLEYYYTENPVEGEYGVSPIPVAQLHKDYPPIVLFKARGMHYGYEQGKFNAIRNRFPKAKYGITSRDMLIASVEGEPVAVLTPTKIGRELKTSMKIPPLRDEAVEAGLLPGPVKTLPEHLQKLVRQKGFEDVTPEGYGPAAETDKALKAYEEQAFSWGSLSAMKKIDIVKKAGWVNKDGNVTPMGNSIAKKGWDEISAAGKNVILKTMAKAPSETYDVYQGKGRAIEEIYRGVAKPVLGDANYYAFFETDAKQFGEITKKKITLKNPLIIDSDTKWKQIVKTVGWKYPNLFGMEPIETSKSIDNLKKYILALNYDSVIIRLAEDDSTKTLRAVFGIEQVADYTGMEKSFKPPAVLSKEQIVRQEKKDLDEHIQYEQDRIKSVERLYKTGKVSKEIADKMIAESKRMLAAARKRAPSVPGLGKPADLGAPGKLRGIDAFEGVEAGSKQADLRLFEETKKIAKKYANIIGERYVPGKFLGMHFGDTKNIFVRALNDLSTTIHEVVHYIDTTKGIFSKIMRKTGESKSGNPIYAPETKKVRKALTDAYIEFYPLAKKTHKLKKRVREGLAVFIEHYVTHPTATKEKYPSLYKEFLEGGEYFDPMLPALVQDARNLIGAYQKLDPLKKVGTKILSDDQPIKNSFMKFHEKVIQELADNIYPLEKIAKEAGARWTSRDPSLWTRLYNNLGGIVSRNIDTNKGFVHFKNETLTKLYDYNWKTLIEELKKDKLTDDFSYWLVARREFFAYQKLDKMKEEVKLAAENAKMLKEQGLLDTVQGQEEMKQAKKIMDDYAHLARILAKDGFSRDIITEAYLQHASLFTDKAKQFDNLVRADLDFLKEVGLVSEKNYQEFIENEGYATFKRDVYNEVVGGGQEVRGVVRTGKRVSSLKGRTGSQLTIINPLYSSIKNHAEIMKKGVKQMILNKVYNLRGHFPDFMQKIPLTKAPQLGGGFQYPQDKDPNILMSMQNGRRYPLLVSEEIMTVINELLTWKNIHLFENLAIRASRMFTKGTTGLYPPFAIQNFFVDQVTATAQTTTKYTPVIDQLNLLYKQLTGHGKQADYLKEYLMLGGQRHTFVGWLDMTPNEYFSAIMKEKNAIQKVGDMLEQGAQIVGTPTQFSEILTRAVEYIKAREAGQHQVVALERAGRVSAPFHHVGRWGGQTTGRTLIKSIPYFNASLQVLAQFSRTLKNPKTRRRALFVVMALTASMVSGFMALLKKGTEEQKRIYKELHPRELAHYIFFPAPNGKTLWRLRVPEQMSVIGTLINMALADALMDTRYSNKEYIDAATAWVPDQFNITDPVRQFFAWMPHVIGPVTEVLMNRRTYPKVMPLEGMDMERHEKQFRYNKHTGWLAKYIGKQLNLSPRKIDYLIEQMIGRTSKFIKGGRITNPVVREEYFNSGRRLVEFYELRKLNEQKYYSLRNDLRKFTPQERDEVLGLRNEIKTVSRMLQIYRDISEKEEKKLETEKLKKDILSRIDSFRYTR